MISALDYEAWLDAVESALRRQIPGISECALCHGSGVRATPCCDGSECTCAGRPVDYDRCPCRAGLTAELEQLMEDRP